jgi:hypothetical protein
MSVTVTNNIKLFPSHTLGEWRNYGAFAVVKTDGSVVTWGYPLYGGDSGVVAAKLDGDIDVVQIFSSHFAFAALRADGSVATWGNPGSGGNSNAVAK